MLDFDEKMVVVRVLDNMAEPLECCKPKTSVQANDVEVLPLMMDSVSRNRNRLIPNQNVNNGMIFGLFHNYCVSQF